MLDFPTYSLISLGVLQILQAVLITQRLDLWVLALAILVAAAANYLIITRSGWVAPAAASTSSLSNQGKIETIAAAVLTVLTAVFNGILMQRFYGMKILEVVGFQFLTSSAVHLLSNLLH